MPNETYPTGKHIKSRNPSLDEISLTLYKEANLSVTIQSMVKPSQEDHLQAFRFSFMAPGSKRTHL